MKLFLFTLLPIFFTHLIHGQENLEKMNPPRPFDNVHIERIGGDNLSTQFVIWVKDTVRTHKHEKHSESLYVLEGKGTFYLNKKSLKIEAGDFITIPKNTWHAVKVTSKEPLKVISIQSPSFYGKDRIFKD